MTRRIDRTSHGMHPVGDVMQTHDVADANGCMIAAVSRRKTGQTHEVTSSFGGPIVTHYIREEIHDGVTISREYVFVGFQKVYEGDVTT